MASKRFIIAKQVGGKRVITNKGEEIGRLSDILIDENDGKLEALVIDPNSESKLARNLVTKERTIEVPYKAVFAVSDVIVVDEALLV